VPRQPRPPVPESCGGVAVRVNGEDVFGVVPELGASCVDAVPERGVAILVRAERSAVKPMGMYLLCEIECEMYMNSLSLLFSLSLSLSLSRSLSLLISACVCVLSYVPEKRG